MIWQIRRMGVINRKTVVLPKIYKPFMKKLQKVTFLFFLLLISCKNDKPDLFFDKEHEKMHQEDEKISEAFTNFENLLNKLYIESEKNPDKVLRKVDSLLIVNKNEKDKYISQIKPNINRSLHSFKAELFYKIGKYKESINELNTEDNKTGDAAIAYAANYVKLKDFKSANHLSTALVLVMATIMRSEIIMKA